MPELPEVETVRRALAAHLPGRRVVEVSARPVRLRRPLNAGSLVRGLDGGRFGEPRRHGKWLLLPVDGRGTLAVHLGMSGRLRLWKAGEPPPCHTHLVLRLDSGVELALVDPRRFGAAVWLDPGAERTDPALAALGPDALDPCLPELLPGAAAGRRVAVKALLMDQRVVAGVGNIYATESLWRARVHPARPAGALAPRTVRRLAQRLQEVLAEAVERGGTTLRDFAGVDGTAGMFQLELDVYGRTGEPCPRCGRPIRRTTLAQRSSWFCPRCQRP